MDVLSRIGLRWCGPGGLPIKRRDGSSTDVSTIKFECHGANEPPDFSSPQTTYASAVTNTTTYADTATETAVIDEDELPATVTPSGFAVNTDGMTVTGTTLGTQATSTGTSTAPQETGPIDASTVTGDADKESKLCVQECVAAFKGCVSTGDTNQIGSMYAMDCHAAAACYCTTPPYQTATTDDSAAPVNPEDPVTDPAVQSSKIDMGKVDGLCSDVSVLASPLFQDDIFELPSALTVYTC